MENNVIEITNLKDYSQIRKGVNIKAPKSVLASNPMGYAKMINDIESYIKKSGLNISHEDRTDFYLIKIS